MPTKYNADEVLEMAGRIETNGAAFYRKAAKFHVGARDLLNQIAAQEDLHYKAFEEMRQSLAPNEQGEEVDPYGDSALYLKAMVEGLDMDVNKDPAEVISGNESLSDIFTMAIGLEKDSIIFYSGLKQLVPAAMGKDKIDAIIQEEMKHIAWLDEKRKDTAAA